MVHRVSASLKQDTSRHDYGKDDDHAFPAKPFSDKQREKRASEAAKIVNTRYESRQRRRWMMEVVLKFMAHDYAAEDALFVAKETHYRASGDGDEGVQASRLKAILRPPSV